MLTIKIKDMEFRVLLYIMISALVATILISTIYKVSGPWGSFWSFLIVLFSAVFAGNLWVEPSPINWAHLRFIPPVALSLIAIILFALIAPSPASREKFKHEVQISDKSQVVETTVNSVYWIGLILILSIVAAKIFI